MMQEYPANPPEEQASNPPWAEEEEARYAPPTRESARRSQAVMLAGAGFAFALLVVCLVLGLLVNQAFSGSAVSDAPISPEPAFASTEPSATPTSAPVTIVAFPTTTRVVTVTPPKPRTSTPKPKATATPAPIKYKVKAGDTLASIAKKYGVTTSDLIRVNGLKETTLKPGQQLLIPRKK